MSSLKVVFLINLGYFLVQRRIRGWWDSMWTRWWLWWHQHWRCTMWYSSL